MQPILEDLVGVSGHQKAPHCLKLTIFLKKDEVWALDAAAAAFFKALNSLLLIETLH